MPKLDWLDRLFVCEKYLDATLAEIAGLSVSLSSSGSGPDYSFTISFSQSITRITYDPNALPGDNEIAIYRDFCSQGAANAKLAIGTLGGDATFTQIFGTEDPVESTIPVTVVISTSTVGQWDIYPVGGVVFGTVANVTIPIVNPVTLEDMTGTYTDTDPFDVEGITGSQTWQVTIT